MELEWQGSVQEDGHRQQKHRTSPQSPPQPGCRGPPFHPASRTVRAGRKCGPGPLHVLAPDHEHFPQPSGTRPHFVFTHNQFLIKFDFSSHLFRSRSPLDMASTKAGTGWQERKANRAEPFHRPLLGRESGSGRAFAWRVVLTQGSLFREISLPSLWNLDRSLPGAKVGSQV